MTHEGDIELTTKRRALIGALIEQLHGLPLEKLELLADAAEYWQLESQREQESAVRLVLNSVRRKRAK